MRPTNCVFRSNRIWTERPCATEACISTEYPSNALSICALLSDSETNYRTEFVAVLSNQPQGGFITRRPSLGVNFCGRRLPERCRLLLFFPGQLVRRQSYCWFLYSATFGTRTNVRIGSKADTGRH